MKKSSAGFTLIEILIVMAILISVISTGFVISFKSFQKYVCKNDRDGFVFSLISARQNALMNGPEDYSVFTIASSTVGFNKLSAFLIAGSTSSILVGEINGMGNVCGDQITINNEGKIEWF